MLLAVVAGRNPVAAEPKEPVVPAGSLDLSLAVETDLSLRKRFDVISAAPDIRYGATDHLTLGVTHSMAARSRIDSGGGLCSGCESSYANVFVDIAYNVYDRARAPTVARLRLGASSTDPAEMSVAFGATGRFGTRRLWVQLDPTFQIGLNRTAEGNESQLEVPLWVARSMWRVTVFARTGIGGPLAALGDEHRIPVGLGASVAITSRIEAGAEIGFPRLLGPLNSERPRHALAYVRTRLGRP